MPLPEFTDAQIDEVTMRFGIRCDAERRAILKHRETTDVRACAGSGKTTLLVAKLALLAQWSERFQGIAILSHTNVAHEEIRRRFAVFPRLQTFERYPHFLGTIQSFINMTLGIPGAVESLQTRPLAIDDDLFRRYVSRTVQHRSYAVVHAWLRPRRDAEAIIAGLRYELEADGSIALASAGGDIPSPESQVGRALLRLKQSAVRNGIFRYDDMDTLGLRYAQRHPEVVAAVAARFPVVFLDETQDTQSQQGRVLDFILRERSVVQRFGDDRQAIYHGGEDGEQGIGFPRAGYLRMSNSLRLSASIARLAENMCMGAVEPLAGDPSRTDHAHTIFLFRPGNTRQVLPAFAELVAAELGCGLSSTQVMAVGFKRSGDSDPQKTPHVIGDYWKMRGETRRSMTTSFASCAEYVSAAMCDLAAHPTPGIAHQRLMLLACRVLEIQGIRDHGKPFNPTSLLRQLREIDNRYAPALLIAFARLLLDGDPRTAIDIAAVRTAVLEGLRPLLGEDAWSQGVGEFFALPEPQLAQEDAAAVEIDREVSADGVFRHRTHRGVVEVGLSTIHSVKGETLTATLVLTTFFYKHDLANLLHIGMLNGARPTAQQSNQVRLRETVKRIHVAMTRPTHLLCLAIPAENIDAEKCAELHRAGWNVQSVASSRA